MRWHLAWLLAGGLAAPAAAYHSGDMIVASTAPGGGGLVVSFDFSQRVYVSPSIELGDVVLHTGTDPGLDGLDTDEPALAPLVPGTPVTFELLSLDGPASLQLKGAILEAPGRTAPVGVMTPDGDGLHVHPTWRLALPVGAGVVRACVRFRLSTSGSYAPSPAYTIAVTNAAPEEPSPPCVVEAPPPEPCAGEAPGSEAALRCRYGLLRDAVDAVPAPNRPARKAAGALFRHASACGRLLDRAGGSSAKRAARLLRLTLARLQSLERRAARAGAAGVFAPALVENLQARGQGLRAELTSALAAGRASR